MPFRHHKTFQTTYCSVHNVCQISDYKHKKFEKNRHMRLGIRPNFNRRCLFIWTPGKYMFNVWANRAEPASNIPANKQDSVWITVELQSWQVAHKLAHLREGMAVPPGQLLVRLLKEFTAEIATPLTHIYNRSIQEGHVPLIWRTTTVTQVPKKPCPPPQLT